ncbi:flagellar biosynthesis protein FlhF [bacterium]|nr:flagellar biosynthesis protein FlhF [bacterium]
MKVKRFRASTMREALQMVREDLGDEAVILKSGKIEHSGFFDMMKKEKVEVVAAVDVSEQSSAGHKANERRMKMSNLSYFKDKNTDKSRLRGSSAQSNLKPPAGFTDLLKSKIEQDKNPDHKQNGIVSKGIYDSDTDAAPWVKPVPEKRTRRPSPVHESARNPVHDETIRNMQEELKDLRSLVRSVTGKASLLNDLSIKEFADMPAPYAEQVMALIERGVEKHIAKMVVERAASSMPVDNVHNTKKLISAIRKTMGSMIKTAGPITCKKGKTKIIALVGPTGVGKTTTLAKLAANSKFVFNKKVALISADTYRMSAIEHLNTFAGIAHLPISAVYSPEELLASLKAQQDKDLVFIDTAGRSPKDRKFLVELKEFMDCAQPDEIHLVIPANIRYMDLLETIRRFGILNINRVIITKTDETVAIGSLLNISSEIDNPVSYITNGQTIPDDIELAKGDKLSRLILETV